VEKQEKEEGGVEGVEEVRLQQGRFNIGIKAGLRSSPDSFIPGDPDPTFKQCCGPVLVRIRIWIQILGSVSLTNRSGSGSCKKLFFLSFSVYYFLKIHLHHFSKRKNRNEVTKQ
jgi:hypothetical protein